MKKLQGLKTNEIGKDLIYFDKINSTNEYLKKEAQRLRHGTVVIADEQYLGRGRMGKSWETKAGTALCMSILLKPIDIDNMTLLPIICAVAVRRAILKMCELKCAVKWLNDIVITNKKLCGILCESKIMGDEIGIICGIGLNVAQSPDFFKDRYLPYATSLFIETGKLFRLENLASAILNEFEPLYNQMLIKGFTPYVEEYKDACITLGKQVKFHKNGKELVGTAIDILDNGSLKINVNGDFHTINSGEASVRGLYGYV